MTVLTQAVLEFVPTAALRRAAEGEGTLVLVVGVDDGLELCRGLRMLAQRHPTARFVVPGAEGALPARYLGGLTNVALLAGLEPRALRWLLGGAQVVLSADGEPADADVPVVALPADRHALVGLATGPVEGAAEALVA